MKYISDTTTKGKVYTYDKTHNQFYYGNRFCFLYASDELDLVVRRARSS